MTVTVLICKPDGTKALEQKELPDGWFDSDEKEQENRAK